MCEEFDVDQQHAHASVSRFIIRSEPPFNSPRLCRGGKENLANYIIGQRGKLLELLKCCLMKRFLCELPDLLRFFSANVLADQHAISCSFTLFTCACSRRIKITIIARIIFFMQCSLHLRSLSTICITINREILMCLCLCDVVNLLFE